MVLLLLVDAVIFMLLRDISGVLALFFLILAVISVPALVLHRREAAAELECSPDAESATWGWLRLFGNLGLDLTGVTLAALIIIAFVLLVHSLGGTRVRG